MEEKAVAEIASLSNLEAVKDYNEKPFRKATPVSKVKRNPQGYDYVSGAYMDKEFKEFAPVYEYVSIVVTDVLAMGHVRAEVVLKNRVTGNQEVGVGAARIQVTREARKRLTEGSQQGILPFDVVSYNNNVKAAVEEARKNCMRGFGICSDVYRRQQFEPTEEESDRFMELMNQVSLKWKQQFGAEWDDLGADFEIFLDGIEDNLDKYKKKEQTKNNNDNKKGSVL
ncbi:MAG: hypothetical protein DRH90_24790 [Deltaproteobacteria bacterium]|nr:MAG: hypothetical protein DRH90_24790 [Deltaproteobacteria bacterium]